MSERSEDRQRDSFQDKKICFRPITEKDVDFLYHVYASTRQMEMSATGWDEAQIEAFLRMQFRLQHTQYTQNYPNASLNIILIDGIPAGRLYVSRAKDTMRIIDITLLPEFRGKGIGGRIMKDLAVEADARGLVMSLHVEVNNPILTLYKSLGFEGKELRGIYYYMEREVMRAR
jgi:ribosomal protein S18 acetylase RimI-like enzyme